MGKKGRRLKLRFDEESRSGGPEREPATRRPFDPNYNRVPYDQDTWEGKMARTYNDKTIAHYAVTRKPVSNGDGHLPQPVHTESSPSQQALRDLLQGAERVFTPLSPEPEILRLPLPIEMSATEVATDDIPLLPWQRRRGTTVFIE